MAGDKKPKSLYLLTPDYSTQGHHKAARETVWSVMRGARVLTIVVVAVEVNVV